MVVENAPVTGNRQPRPELQCGPPPPTRARWGASGFVQRQDLTLWRTGKHDGDAHGHQRGPAGRLRAAEIGQREVAEVVATLESGWLSTGPRVQQFERAFADYIGASHAVAVNSGTAALHLSLLAAGIGAGDEVVTTPLTFCATANVVVHVGATPRFADIDPATLEPQPGRLQPQPSRRARAR